MKHFASSGLKVITLLLLVSSCSITRKWPKSMKPITYSGKVINERTGKGVAGAEIQFLRPHYKFAKSMMGDWAVSGFPEKLGKFRSDQTGNFTATINAGYATTARAESGGLSGHVGSATQNHSDSKPLPNHFNIKIGPLKYTVIKPSGRGVERKKEQ